MAAVVAIMGKMYRYWPQWSWYPKQETAPLGHSAYSVLYPNSYHIVVTAARAARFQRIPLPRGSALGRARPVLRVA